MLIILLVIVLVLGLGGGRYYGQRSDWGPMQYRTGGVGGLLIILLILYLLLAR